MVKLRGKDSVDEIRREYATRQLPNPVWPHRPKGNRSPIPTTSRVRGPVATPLAIAQLVERDTVVEKTASVISRSVVQIRLARTEYFFYIKRFYFDWLNGSLWITASRECNIFKI